MYTDRKGCGQAMDFRELTYITAVADERSVTEAAKKLYISQPSLSYIIGKVEEDLGVKLFDRKTNPISLTYAGEKYVESAREILRMRDNMRREMTDIGHGQKGRINIGIPNERAGYMLPRVIRRFRKQYPNVEIRLQESRSEEIIRYLMMDKIAFCVLPGDQSSLPPAIETEFIYRENLYMVAGENVIPDDMFWNSGNPDEDFPKNASGRKLRRADLKKMKSMPFILMKRGQYIRKKTDSIFKKAGYFPKEVMEVSGCLTAVQLADAGMGITIVPERAILALGGFQNFHCCLYSDRQDSWDVNAVYKEDTYLDRAERTLIDTMKDVFGNT